MSDINPGIPNSPETAAVTKLIGIWRPYWLPKTFKKNNKIAPINSLINPCPKKRSDFVGAPINSSTMIKVPIKEITKIGSTFNMPPPNRLYYNLCTIF